MSNLARRYQTPSIVKRRHGWQYGVVLCTIILCSNIYICSSQAAVEPKPPNEEGAVTASNPDKEQKHLRKQQPPPEKSNREFFQLIDANRDGYISPAEYNSGLDLLIDTLSAKQKKQLTLLNAKQRNEEEDLSFLSAFVNSVAMILATEIGDKTFFIAAVLSMRNERFVVFSGAISALVVMTVLSSMMGLVLPSILPRQYTHIIGGVLFLYFGTRLLLDSRKMSSAKCSDELEEVEHELFSTTNKKKEDESTAKNQDYDPEQPPTKSIAMSQKLFLQAFTLTFLAEWGDRSQIATIALAAAKDPWGVNIGAILGHTICTGMAVLGGRMLAASISEKTVSMWGGVIFWVFGLHSLFFEEV